MDNAASIEETPKYEKMLQITVNKKLMYYAYNGKLDDVKWCIENGGADKDFKDDEEGMLPLMCDVDDHVRHLVNYLAEYKNNAETRDTNKWTPLVCAVCTNRYDVVEYLVQKGCDKEARNKRGQTPLLLAVWYGHLRIAKFLFSKHSDVKTKDLDGSTAYHLAVLGNHPHILKWLIEETNCNPLELTYKGNTSFDLVTKYRNGEDENTTRDRTNVIDYLKKIEYTIGQRNSVEGEILNWPQVESTSPKPKSVIPRKWMSFFTTIDSELPSKFRWIRENDEELEIMEKDYLNLLKDLLKKGELPIFDGSKYSGIYQCVRTLETGREDIINVVLHVRESRQKVSMIVNPECWEKKMFDKHPATIKQHLSKMKCTTHPHESVKWEYRPKRLDKYKTLRNNSQNALQMERNFRGEYRCTVSLEDEIQIYFFVLQFSNDEVDLSEETSTIIGVPSVLELKEKFLYFAYGSNLLKQRLKLNNQSAEYYTKAKLKHYRLDFIAVKDPKTSKWNGGVANITQSEGGDVVWGTVWKLNVEDIPSLNRQEGFYKPVDVVVMSDEKGPLKCRTYLVESSIDRSREWAHEPSYLYKAVIINGAVESKLDKDYIEKLLKIDVNGYQGPFPADTVPADTTT